MTCAPAGTSTFAPMAAILPSRMTSVPSSMGAPARVKIFAWLRAKLGGGCDCAGAFGLKQQAAATIGAKRRIILMLMLFTEHLRRRLAAAWACPLAFLRPACLR